MMLDQIKRKLSYILIEFPGSYEWNKWCNRYQLGIDTTPEAAEKGLKLNEKDYHRETGNTCSLDSFVFNNLTDKNLNVVPFIIRSSATRMALAYSKSKGEDTFSVELEKDILDGCLENYKVLKAKLEETE